MTRRLLHVLRRGGAEPPPPVGPHALRHAVGVGEAGGDLVAARGKVPLRANGAPDLDGVLAEGTWAHVFV